MPAVSKGMHHVKPSPGSSDLCNLGRIPPRVMFLHLGQAVTACLVLVRKALEDIVSLPQNDAFASDEGGVGEQGVCFIPSEDVHHERTVKTM